MGDVVVVAREQVSGTPQHVFSRFGRPTAGGWLFDAECDGVLPGRVVRFSMPLRHGARVDSVGRIVDVVAGQKIVVMQESPWCSRIELNFRPNGRRTQVTATVTVGDDCMRWLMQEEGYTVMAGARSEDEIRVGIMISLSGPAAVFGRACRNAAELAIEEINLDGGVVGRPLRAVVADDKTDHIHARLEYQRLVELERCHAVVAMVSSASMATVRPVALATGNLLLHCPVHEGLRSTGTVFHLGQDPASQLSQSISDLMSHSGDRAWAFVGNDYNWPRAVRNCAEYIISRNGGVLLSERFIPLGSESFDEVIDSLSASGATNILSAMVGSDAVHFERQSYAAGLRGERLTLSLLFDEAVREHVGNDAANGVWSVQSYFRELDTGANRQLNARWMKRFGPLSPPLTSTAATVYDAVYRYASAARQARSLEPGAVARELAQVVNGNGQCVSGAGVLAQAVPGGFRIHDNA